MKDRNVVSASLSPGAKKDLNSLAADLGMTQKEMFGRLLGWLRAQERMVQLIAVKMIPADQTDDIIEYLHQRRSADPGIHLDEATLARLVELLFQRMIEHESRERKAGRRKAR